MGATEFYDTEFGKNAEDAFRKAREEALYQYGHDPYNGTISTVAGFKEITIPKGFSSDEFVNLVWTLESTDLENMPIKRKFEHEWQRQDYKRKRVLANKFKKLPLNERLDLKRAHFDIVKWECCLAFKVPHAEQVDLRKIRNMAGKHGAFYAFFGLAAC
jgi:hypothetical protein